MTKTTISLLDQDLIAQLAYKRYAENFTTDQLEDLINALPDSTNPEFLEAVVQCFYRPNTFDANQFLEFNPLIVLDYLKKSHRLYLHKKLPEIDQSIEILRKNYEAGHPCLKLLHLFFTDYKIHLYAHIQKEDEILFPYMEKLFSGKHPDNSIKDLDGSASLGSFYKEHTDTEHDLKKVRQVIRAYEPSPTNKSPYSILLSQLQVFELDLHIHALLEEEVLIPQAIFIDKQLRAL